MEQVKERKPKEAVYSNRIRAILKEKNMTQKELSVIALNGNKSHLCRIINGSNQHISLPIAYKIAKALGRPIEEVFICKV